MSKAYVIEVQNRTAGIVTADGRKFRFFSSARAFDRLEGREFRSARDAERAANAVYNATGVRVRDYPITLDKLLDRMPEV